ncbi:sulfotransferase domain-containing protein [Metabacillus sp. 113a]|uniref:sulfotransferase domain-containing protein n=1 Tax=Metabacillus sp. 113a TaxID=3404706 RepID=UPI003CEE140E
MNLPRIFVNSVPKSGTHLLLQIMLGIPGTRKVKGILGENANYVKEMVPGEVTYGHLYYVKNTIDLLNNENIRRFFIYRDPRDVTVSMVYYALYMSETTFLHNYLKNTPGTVSDHIMTVINGIKNLDVQTAETLLHGHTEYPNINEFYNQFMDWSQDPNTFSVRYEELIDQRNRHHILHNMAGFLEEDLKGLDLEKEKIAEMMNHNINPKMSPTFREGKTGGWKNHFTEEHKRRFKEVAGDLLIRLGYETDDHW